MCMETPLNAKVKVKPESNELNSWQFIKSKIGFDAYKELFATSEVIELMAEYAKYKNGKA